MYDSPGILTPSVQDVEEGMKLAVCGEGVGNNMIRMITKKTGVSG